MQQLTDRQAAAEARMTAAYRAMPALELAVARARSASDLLAIVPAREALRAGWLEIDRAEIEHGRAAEEAAAPASV